MSETATVPAGHLGEGVHRAAREGRPVLFAVPLILVNAAGLSGQGGWAYEHIASGWVAWFAIPFAIAFAGAVESVGIYLAWESHAARMNDQPSGLLRFGSYMVGAFAGWLNWDHFHQQNPSLAFTFAAFSILSPILWGIWSTARNRARLQESGGQDSRGVKFGLNRWLWHPKRTFAAYRWAAWEGITDPRDAVRGWDLDAAGAPVSGGPVRMSNADRLEQYREIAHQRPGISQVQAARLMGITDRQLRSILKAEAANTR